MSKTFIAVTVLAFLVLAGLSTGLVIYSSASSRSEMQKLRAQLYDMQQELAKREAKESSGTKPEKEEHLVAAVVTAPSKTPPSEVRQGGAAKASEKPAAPADDLSSTLAELQEAAVKEASKGEMPKDITETVKPSGQDGQTAKAEEPAKTPGEEASKDKNLDMSDVDAIIREAEQKLVAQYGEDILKKEEPKAEAPKSAETKTETTAVAATEAKSESKTEAKTEAKAVEKPASIAAKKPASNPAAMVSENPAAVAAEKPASVAAEKPAAVAAEKPAKPETPSWKGTEGLPGETPVAETKTVDRTPRPINNQNPMKEDVRPVAGDSRSASAPSWNADSAAASSSAAATAVSSNTVSKAQAKAPARSVSLKPASEVIVPLTAKEEVERDIREEKARRQGVPEVRTIERKNYNAIGNRTMAEILKAGK